MALRKILHVGDETLRGKARPVDVLNRRMLMLLDDMAETMYAAEGVGLAAPQVGVLRRAITIDVGDETGLIQLINPEIIASEGEQEEAEGCLSVPGRRGYVKRPQRVVVRGINRAGKPVEIRAEGLLAVAFCHEIDHLDGVLFIDKMTREVDEEDGEESEA
ncbi:MAG: peptide deformylase [Christensenellales bacterium]|uniref:Peptide deformylase n=1 Tax=Candidatus Avichristensenella intestinipullorum TaxID=2840693 RepID=A0A9D0YX79_9FIRM|nr:peptide deformylase [Christensenellales bacterium]HIQ63076.1 peptide deformylase [Candidatus Avichristensenella intestinipullorum]